MSDGTVYNSIQGYILALYKTAYKAKIAYLNVNKTT